jgi:hypothetical protein
MKVKTLAMLFLLCLLFLTACVESVPPTPTPTPGSKGLGPSDISLKVGEEVYLENAQITLILNAVTEDSRCPTSVTCIHAGWVTVDISMKEDGDTTGQFFWTLPQKHDGPPSEVTVDDIIIRLLAVKPYPQEPGGIPQDEYEVILEIIEDDDG